MASDNKVDAVDFFYRLPFFALNNGTILVECYDFFLRNIRKMLLTPFTIIVMRSSLAILNDKIKECVPHPSNVSLFSDTKC